MLPEHALDQHWARPAFDHLLSGADHRLVFAHTGPIDHKVVEDLLARAEAASLAVGDAVTVRKRLFNVLVESLENVHHHAVGAHRSSAFAVLFDTGEGYRLVLGNSMPVAMAALLTHRVEVLNSMDEADLKQHFMLMLGNDARTERGGAGLGLLTMARKCHRPILVRSFPLDQQSVHLVMEVAVLR